MREFLAFPFYMVAKMFAGLASAIDTESVLCISTRECIEITDETMDEIFKEMDNE